MNEWWDGLSLLLKVLYCIAFPSTLILLVQTLLSMFGFHDGGSGHDFSDTSGLDLDVDTNISGHGDVDIGHCTHDIGCDHNVDGGNPADFASMRMFTLQTIVAFFTVFSWSSIVLVSSGVYPALSTVIGFVLGLATMLLVAKIVQLSARLAENGTADYKNAIGETATVYIPCPPKDHGLGKVNVMINGQLREVTAINNGDELIERIIYNNDESGFDFSLANIGGNIEIRYNNYRVYSDKDECVDLLLTKENDDDDFPRGYVSFYIMNRSDFEESERVSINLEKFMRDNK